MPRRTCVTSAPTASHSRAIWFMNEMRVASIAFAAYFVISADGMSMTMSGFPLGTNLFRGANGNGAFGDHELWLVHVFADRARHIEDVLQVRRAVFIRRCPD